MQTAQKGGAGRKDGVPPPQNPPGTPGPPYLRCRWCPGTAPAQPRARHPRGCRGMGGGQQSAPQVLGCSLQVWGVPCYHIPTALPLRISPFLPNFGVSPIAAAPAGSHPTPGVWGFPVSRVPRIPPGFGVSLTATNPQGLSSHPLGFWGVPHCRVTDIPPGFGVSLTATPPMGSSNPLPRFWGPSPPLPP